MLASKDLIAIDLSSHDLKIAQASISPTKKEIVNLASRSIQNLSEEDTAKVVKEIIRELQVTRPRIIGVIPSFLTITKNIEIPSRDPQEIREIINLQASRHTPYSREEIIIDYINIGSYKQNYTKVLLVIATRSIIRKQLEILDKAGLSVERMAFAPEGIGYAVSKSLRLASQDSPVSVIHIDEGFTDFLITLRDKVTFIRNIPIGAQHLSGERDKYEPKFVDEVRKSLEVYASEDVGQSPIRFFLTGAVGNLEYLTETLNTVLRIPFESFPYFNYLAVSQKAAQIGSLHGIRLSFLNPIAAALTFEDVKLDLVPEEIKLEKSLKQKGREIIKAGILVMAAFVLIYCIMLVNIYVKSGYLKKLSGQFGAIHQEAQELEGDFAKNQLIRDFLSARGYSLEVLAEFYSALPLDVKISYLKFDDEGTFSIEGTAESMATVFSFVDNLSKSRYFKKVETRYTRKRKEGEKDVADFSVTCALNKEIQ
ncbi:MAG: pilus assembly protein PilM [Candidatus Omnitrophota bacterium]